MAVEKTVRDFYDGYGWKKVTEGQLGEDKQFRQFSKPYYRYPDADNRTISCFSHLSGRLLIAGGGDLPESHVRIASKFSNVCCLDISRTGLDIAKSKLEKSHFVLGSILNIPFPDDYFDAVFCAHVIYHIDIDLQERAVDELIRTTKPRGRIVILYSNPESLMRRIVRKKKRLPILWRMRRGSKAHSNQPSEERPPLYYALHPLRWWQRFGTKCDLSFMPWDVMEAEQESELLWNDTMAAIAYWLCHRFERKYPEVAVKWWQFPIIVLDKHHSSAT